MEAVWNLTANKYLFLLGELNLLRTFFLLKKLYIINKWNCQKSSAVGIGKAKFCSLKMFILISYLNNFLYCCWIFLPESQKYQSDFTPRRGGWVLQLTLEHWVLKLTLEHGWVGVEMDIRTLGWVGVDMDIRTQRVWGWNGHKNTEGVGLKWTSKHRGCGVEMDIRNWGRAGVEMDTRHLGRGVLKWTPGYYKSEAEIPKICLHSARQKSDKSPWNFRRVFRYFYHATSKPMLRNRKTTTSY